MSRTLNIKSQTSLYQNFTNKTALNEAKIGPDLSHTLKSVFSKDNRFCFRVQVPLKSSSFINKRIYMKNELKLKKHETHKSEIPKNFVSKPQEREPVRSSTKNFNIPKLAKRSQVNLGVINPPKLFKLNLIANDENFEEISKKIENETEEDKIREKLFLAVKDGNFVEVKRIVKKNQDSVNFCDPVFLKILKIMKRLDKMLRIGAQKEDILILLTF